MVKSMQVAQGIPHFGYCDEIDMTRLVALRKTLKKVAEKKGIKFSYMPVIIKVRLLCLLTSVFTIYFLTIYCHCVFPDQAISMALLEFPILNASPDETCENIVYKVRQDVNNPRLWNSKYYLNFFFI